MLPDDVLGAFVRGPNGQPGTILISDSLRHNPKKLAEVMLEEVGEAISDHAKHEGFEPAAGDVGNRIMQVVRGVPPEQVSFEVNDGGLADDVELDPNTNYDEQYVLVNGVRRPAKTATEDAVDFGEMAEEWGVTEVEAAEAVSIAEENFERRDAEFLWADDPDVDNEAEWGRFVTIYGNGNKIGVYGMARAIVDGTMTLADNSVNEDAFAGLDLTQVSNHTLTDKIWTHAEESATAGVARSQISLTLLADAVAYVTGDAAGFTDNGTDWEAIQDTFADEIVEGETRQSGAEGPTRFSKDAIQSIWDSGAFAVTGYPDDGSITFEVDPTAAPAGSGVEDAAASVDPGLIGTGSTAFGVPEDATVSDITFMSAENNPTNRAVLFTTYTTASDPDNEYYVTLDATSGDYEVLSATVINGDADSVIVYDSEGSISEEFTISEWDPIANIVEGNNGEVIAEQIVTGIENQGHQVLTDQASPDASFAIYVDKDDGEHYIRYRFVNEDGTFAPPITALADSVEGSAVLDVHEQSSRIEEANFQNGQPSNHRLQVLESGVAIGAVIPEGATVFAAYEGAAAAALFPPVAIGVAIGVAAVVAYKYRHEIADGLQGFGNSVRSLFKSSARSVANTTAGNDGGASSEPAKVVAQSDTGTQVTLTGTDGQQISNKRKIGPNGNGDDDDPKIPRLGDVPGGHYVDMPDALRWGIKEAMNVAGDVVKRINSLKENLTGKGAPSWDDVTWIRDQLQYDLEALAYRNTELNAQFDGWVAQNGAAGADVAEVADLLAPFMGDFNLNFIQPAQDFLGNFNDLIMHGDDPSAQQYADVHEMIDGFLEGVGVPYDQYHDNVQHIPEAHRNEYYMPGGNLADQEKAGGHTLLDHFGQDAQGRSIPLENEELEARIASNSDIHSASTFDSVTVAIKAIARTLAVNGAKIARFLQSNAPRLTLNLETGHQIGSTMYDTNMGVVVPQTRIRVILEADPSQETGYIIKTAFPKENQNS